MDEFVVKTHARLAALEYMVSHLYATYFRVYGVSLSEAIEHNNTLRRQAEKLAFPQADPSISDLAAAEFQEALERILSTIETLMKRIPKV